MKLPQAMWIGAAQILSAVFPGTSRSMCTIAAGQIAGLSRPAALEFSFFLSMPTMLVATGYDFLKTVMPAPSRSGYCPAGDEFAYMDRARNRICRFVFRSAGCGRMVYELGACPWVCALCHLPDRARNRIIDAANSRDHVNQLPMGSDVILPDLQSAVLCEDVRCEINGMQTLVGVLV